MINVEAKAPEAKRFFSSLFDTVKVKISLKHEQLYHLRMENPKRILYVNRKYMVRGKFKGTFAIICSADRGQSLYIEASIPKFLTGQNLVGHEDLRKGAIELIDCVLRRMRVRPSFDEAKAYRSGEFELLRVDYANHLSCGSAGHARTVMEAARARTASKAWEYSAYEDETLYWRQRSSRITKKMYDKGREMAARPLGPRVFSAENLMKFSVGLIRIELTLRADELKRLDLRDPNKWSPEVARALMEQHIAEMLPLEGLVPDRELLQGLPPSLRDRLELWLRGASDAFHRYPGAYAANKRVVLATTGIDITSTLTPEEQAKVMITSQSIFKEGWGYRSWEKNWEKLKKGSDE